MNAAHDLPHPFDGLALATQDLSGIACAVHDGTVPVIKQQPSDFLVEEQALYHPSGDGEHLYLYVQKSRLTTHSCARILAEHFRVDGLSVGYAGLKDTQAITRQMFSVHLPGRRREAFSSLEHDRIEVLWSDWHTNKLRRGHLAGNRFSIRIRNVDPSSAVLAHQCLRVLERAGVPNYFGPQRFGIGMNNHRVGLALVMQSWAEAIDLLLGPEKDRIVPPQSARLETALTKALARGDSHERACRMIRPNERSIFVSALQSAMFNQILSRRIGAGTLGMLVKGDRAQREGQHNTFLVTESSMADADLLRDVEAMQVSTTGPMWGPKMQRAASDVDATELGVLHEFGLADDDLTHMIDLAGDMGAGERRSMRVRVTETDVEGGVDEIGPYVRCAFTLPKGAFATSVLREIIKCDASLRSNADSTAPDRVVS